MTNIKFFSKLYSVAEKAHAPQFRRDGKTPYFYHCEKVASNPFLVKQELPHDWTLRSIAIGHDLFEDTEITRSDLEVLQIPEVVIIGIETLTKTKGISYQEYLARVKANVNARIVKIADMLSNLSDDPTDKQIVKYSGGLIYLMHP